MGKGQGHGVWGWGGARGRGGPGALGSGLEAHGAYGETLSMMKCVWELTFSEKSVFFFRHPTS